MCKLRELRIKEACQEACLTARDKGWFDTANDILEADMSEELRKDLHRLFIIKALYDISAEAIEAVEHIKRGSDAHTNKSGLSNLIIHDISQIKETPLEELADIVIRTMSIAHYLRFDLEGAIETKMKFNKTRPYMHGKVS